MAYPRRTSKMHYRRYAYLCFGTSLITTGLTDRSLPLFWRVFFSMSPLLTSLFLIFGSSDRSLPRVSFFNEPAPHFPILDDGLDRPTASPFFIVCFFPTSSPLASLFLMKGLTDRPPPLFSWFFTIHRRRHEGRTARASLRPTRC
jgi:hypothetical protein